MKPQALAQDPQRLCSRAGYSVQSPNPAADAAGGTWTPFRRHCGALPLSRGLRPCTAPALGYLTCQDLPSPAQPRCQGEGSLRVWKWVSRTSPGCCVPRCPPTSPRARGAGTERAHCRLCTRARECPPRLGAPGCPWLRCHHPGNTPGQRAPIPGPFKHSLSRDTAGWGGFPGFCHPRQAPGNPPGCAHPARTTGDHPQPRQGLLEEVRWENTKTQKDRKKKKDGQKEKERQKERH